MRQLQMILVLVLLGSRCPGQDLPPTAEQQLESLAEEIDGDPEDDSYLLQMERYLRSPLNINIADINELRELGMLSQLQIDNLVNYREVFGKLINKYEMQAIPTWDVATVRKLMPFITVSSPVNVREDVFGRMFSGLHTFLMRYTQTLERAKGFDRTLTGSRYLGSPQRLYLRHRYVYKNLLQYGFVGEKDAGESFFKGAQRRGFDFYSFHFFVRKLGSIAALAVGDFTVSMGQGLLQWQGMAFKKSVDGMAIKRQAPVLAPYNSAGEFAFSRGLGITIRRKAIELTLFGSLRKLSANTDGDAAGSHVTSFQASGNHRTETEIAGRHLVQQLSTGTTGKYQGRRGHVAINAIYFIFSQPIQKREEPYNLFAIRGREWLNVSMDYSHTYRNVHLFGEVAVDRNRRTAILNGMLVSVDAKVDVSLLYRHLADGYQAVYGNAFTENTTPGNERGLYAGISVRPASAWRFDAYADIFRSRWLRYLVDAPGYGKEFLLQVTHTPSRHVELYTR